MSQVVLYRIEHPTGEGMYVRLGESHSPARHVFGYDDDSHVAPEDDRALDRNLRSKGRSMRDYYFAFATMHQLKQWVYFDPWLINLHLRGCVLAEIICDKADVIIGDYQALFRINGDWQKTQHSIQEYFNLSLDKDQST